MACDENCPDSIILITKLTHWSRPPTNFGTRSRRVQIALVTVPSVKRWRPHAAVPNLEGTRFNHAERTLPIHCALCTVYPSIPSILSIPSIPTSSKPASPWGRNSARNWQSTFWGCTCRKAAKRLPRPSNLSDLQKQLPDSGQVEPRTSSSWNPSHCSCQVWVVDAQ